MKLSPQNKHFCVCEITLNCLKTGVEVRKKLKADLHVIVSNNIVCNTLQEAGLGVIEKELKPMLLSKNIKACL